MKVDDIRNLPVQTARDRNAIEREMCVQLALLNQLLRELLAASVGHPGEVYLTHSERGEATAAGEIRKAYAAAGPTLKTQGQNPARSPQLRGCDEPLKFKARRRTSLRRRG